MLDQSSKRLKHPRDLNLFAKMPIEIAKEGEPPETASDKNPHAVALGRLGGLKGGPARAKKLSAEERKEAARKAAKARWSKK